MHGKVARLIHTAGTLGLLQNVVRNLLSVEFVFVLAIMVEISDYHCDKTTQRCTSPLQETMNLNGVAGILALISPWPLGVLLLQG